MNVKNDKSENTALQNLVREHLEAYLDACDLRHTRERFAILRVIYDTEGIFSIEDLAEAMQRTKFHVSRATLYNTTQLLVEANLLIRHPFSSGATQFERITDTRPRSYQICGHCHRITLIKGRELQADIEKYRPRSFRITHRILYVYGLCGRCARAMKKGEKGLRV